MAKYLIIYYGGKIETDPKKMAEINDQWNKWFARLGKGLVDMGGPSQPGKLVSAKGIKNTGAKSIAGYSIFQAENLDAAVKMLRTSPVVLGGGQAEVYPLISMMM